MVIKGKCYQNNEFARFVCCNPNIHKVMKSTFLWNDVGIKDIGGFSGYVTLYFVYITVQYMYHFVGLA